jgi:hypothetical protein
MTKSGKQLRLAGKIILLLGVLAAAVIYVRAKPEENAGILGIDIRTNRDRLQLERMGGKNYVMLKDMDDWFVSLWHGRRLGCTIGVLSVLGFVVCRALAFVEDDIAKTAAEERQRKLPPPPTLD